MLIRERMLFVSDNRVISECSFRLAASGYLLAAFLHLVPIGEGRPDLPSPRAVQMDTGVVEARMIVIATVVMRQILYNTLLLAPLLSHALGIS